MANQREIQLTQVKGPRNYAADDDMIITHDARELMQWLTKFCAKKIECHYHPADVVNSMMGATINVALKQVPRLELSKWLHVVAKEIAAKGKKHTLS